ncbi:MAG: AAC(6')-I family aminoglycoside N-acetyltransferase [Acidobacteria bacterium]|nr:MAG: AAC(6')-I family aminoglycoside N-acetyltransferase [Acidobacteriota bacterium]
MIAVRGVTSGDAAAWLALRHALWPESSAGEHWDEIERFLAGGSREPLAVLLAFEPGGRAVGLAELSIRSFAEGCSTDRVAYLEGWFVEPQARGQGVGGLLVEAAERWARGQGCTELASDSGVDNDIGAGAHRALGFTEVGVVRCFRKDL